MCIAVDKDVMSRYDTAAHIAEEVVDAHIAVPRAMIYSVINGNELSQIFLDYNKLTFFFECRLTFQR